MTENDASGWPPPRDASMLDVLLAAVARLEGIGVKPWNIAVEPPRTVMVTLPERPSDDQVDEIAAVLHPVAVRSQWHEAFVEPAEFGADLVEDDRDARRVDGCAVCGGTGPLRECLLDPSAQPDHGFALAARWHLCADCLATIEAADPDALRSRMRSEDREAPYADVLLRGLLDGIKPEH